MNSPYFMPVTFCMAITIFVVGGVYEWIRQVIFKKIEQVCFVGRNNLLKSLKSKFLIN